MATYDVFLSHASTDKPSVEALARRLREDGFEPFLDIWHLVPGEPWQEALEDALKQSRTSAVFVGGGEGPWQNLEMRAVLTRRARDETFRVIPVLLPGAPDLEELPAFLEQLTVVDFRDGLDDDDAYHRLVCGIRGEAPDAGSAPPARPSRPDRPILPTSGQFVHRRELEAVSDVDDETTCDQAVERTLDVTPRRLAADQRRRFQELAVFPEHVEIPLGVLERFWGLPAREVRRLCKRLCDLSLLLRYERGSRTIRLHDVVRQYLIAEHDDLPALHRRLLERCRPPSGRWTDLADSETYLWRHLAGHLIGAGERAELRRLLFDLDYLEGKLRAVEVNALLADYDLLGEAGEVRTVQEALRLSAHVLSRDWGKLLGQILAGQLLGRLVQGGQEGHRLLRRATDRAPLRPRRVTMNRTGGALIRTLEGHTGVVKALAVLDETRVVSACSDRSLRVWDVVSGETIRILKGHTNWVEAVAVLDERRVVSASEDGTLRVWDVASGETIRTLEGHTDGVNAVAVLDETRVVSASEDCTLRVWDVASGETIRTLALGLIPFISNFFRSLRTPRMAQQGHTSGVRDVVMLNETRLVSASLDRTVRVWDVASGKVVRVLEGHTEWVKALAVLDETRVVSASLDRTVRVWDVASGETIRILEGHTEGVNAIAVLGERHVVSASFDRTIRVWDVASGETIRTLEGHTDGVFGLAVLDETHLLSGSADHTVRLWDVASGETIPACERHTAAVRALAVLDERRVVSASDDNTLRVWDVTSGQTIQTLEGHTAAVRALAMLDATRVVSASQDGSLRVWDVASGKTIRTLQGHTHWVEAVAGLDKTRVVSGSFDTVRVWNVESGKTIRTLEVDTGSVYAVVALEETSVVLACSGSLRVWNVASGETIRTFEGDFGPLIKTIAVLHGTCVVSVESLGRILRVWDVASGETIRTLEGHIHWVNALAVLDETRVVSASDDCTLRVWDVASGKAVAVFRLESSLRAVAVTPDGRTVVAGDETGGVHFLDLDPPAAPTPTGVGIPPPR